MARDGGELFGALGAYGLVLRGAARRGRLWRRLHGAAPAFAPLAASLRAAKEQWREVRAAAPSARRAATDGWRAAQTFDLVFLVEAAHRDCLEAYATLEAVAADAIAARARQPAAAARLCAAADPDETLATDVLVAVAGRRTTVGPQAPRLLGLRGIDEPVACATLPALSLIHI